MDTPAEVSKLSLPTLNNVVEQFGQQKAEAYAQLCVVELLNYISVGGWINQRAYREDRRIYCRRLFTFIFSRRRACFKTRAKKVLLRTIVQQT